MTQEYYEYEIENYISFLSCDLNDYKESDKQIVTKYLSELKQIIPVYFKITQEVDDGEYELFELLNMRSQAYKDNYYDFSKVMDYANGAGNFTSGRISLKILIEEGLLPDYSFKLSDTSLKLLIHAIDHELFTKENSSYGII